MNIVGIAIRYVYNSSEQTFGSVHVCYKRGMALRQKTLPISAYGQSIHIVVKTGLAVVAVQP